MSKRLLIADDDQLLTALLKYRLEKGGYSVDIAEDGRQVKDYLNQQMPDVIISDIMMPYFSGIELVDYIRNSMHSSVPIIIISTAGNEENVLAAFELGADDFIAKPVNPSELMLRLLKVHK